MAAQYMSEYHHLRANLLAVSAQLLMQVNQMMAPFGITQQQFNILRILRGQKGKPLSTQQIRELMLDRASDASRLVDRLVAKGLVTKTPAETDRRLLNVQISEAGLALLSEIDAEMGKLDALLGALTEEEARSANALLDKLNPHH